MASDELRAHINLVESYHQGLREADASRRGLFKSAAGLVAASTLPEKSVMNMIKDLGGARNVDILARMVREVPDLEAVVDMTRRLPIDVDMNDITYVLARDRIGERLLERLGNEWKRVTSHLPPLVHANDLLAQRLTDEDDFSSYMEKQRAAEIEADEINRRNRGEKRGIYTDRDTYIQWRIAREVADELGYTPAEINNIYTTNRKNERDRIILKWDILAKGADRLAGRKTDLSKLASVLHHAGVSAKEWTTGNHDMWKILQDTVVDKTARLPANWPRLAHQPNTMKDTVGRTAAGIAGNTRVLAGLLRTVAGMLRSGGPVLAKPNRELGVRPIDRADPRGINRDVPAALPAPDLDLGDPLVRTVGSSTNRI